MIVTISREFGSGALAVASGVAERCGLRLVVDELATRAGVEETQRPFLERLAAGFDWAVPELGAVASPVDPRSADVHDMESAILNEAESDNAVLVGGAAAFVLGPRENVVRVFLHAPRHWRIARVVEWLGYSDEAAAAEVDRLDAARAAYVRERYRSLLTDVHPYDVTLDVQRLGFSCAADIIAAAVDARRQAL